MRPRVIPAEDIGYCRCRLDVWLLASMRPRVIPAEDLAVYLSRIEPVSQASMRPRVIPAEDSSPGSGVASSLVPLQ